MWFLLHAATGSAAAAAASASAPAPLFGWPLWSDRSITYTPTFSGGSWEATLPLTNLADRRLARITRSTDAALISTLFDVDLLTSRAVGLLALPKHTLSVNALVRWRGSSVSNFATSVYDSGWVSAWPAGADAEDLDGLNAAVVTIPSSDQTARYWRCEIDDTANAAGYIGLGRVVIAGAWYPSTGISVGAKIGLEAATERIVTDGGAALYRPKSVRRYWDFTVAMLAETESYGQAWMMQRQLGQHGQVFFVYDANDTTYQHERSFLAVLRELSAVESPFASYQSVPFRLLEEL